MKKIRIGVMGCADIAQRLMIPAIKELHDQFELIGVASRTMNKAKIFSSIFACEAIEGYGSLIDRDDIDAIYMPLPTGLHKEWIIKSVEKGKHVYAEKSLAMNSKDAKIMVNAARTCNVALMEGYMFQYHQQHKIVKQLILDGEIGEIRDIRASFGFPPFKDQSNFRYDKEIGGGALKDTAGYVFRAANFLYNNQFTVSDASVHYSHGISLYGNAFLSSKNTVSAYISFGFDNYYQSSYEIWGSLGKLTAIRAFTPKPNEKTIIIHEKQNYINEITCPPCNHFVESMKEFYTLCAGMGDKEKHYTNIVLQSEGLDLIENISKEKNEKMHNSRI